MTSRERMHALRGPARVLPSILSADFAALAASIEPVEHAGAEVLHLDVMDGHFVPNITFGPPLVRSLRAKSAAFFDAHLMIEEPLRYLAAFAKAGVDSCTIHAELDLEPADAVKEAHALGIGLGVAIRPSTELDPHVEHWAPFVDLILVMSVEPGFGGQKFMPNAIDRLRRAGEICERLGCSPILEVDGGIDLVTAPSVLQAGARWLVAGSAVFGAPDPAESFRAMTALGASF